MGLLRDEYGVNWPQVIGLASLATYFASVVWFGLGWHWWVLGALFLAAVAAMTVETYVQDRRRTTDRNIRPPPPSSQISPPRHGAAMSFWRDEYGINWPHIVGIASLIGFVTAVAGELLGWWDEFGDLLGLASVVGGAVSLVTTASRKQVNKEGQTTRGEIRGLRTEVREGFEDLGHDVRTGLGAVGRDLQSVRDAQSEQTGLLSEIRDLLRGRGGVA